MIVRNSQLREGAQHPFRRFATQFRGFNFEITRQNSTNGRYRHTQALTAVWRTADDVQQAIAADIHFCHTQFVSVRMLCTLNHFTNDHAVEATGNRFYTINFQARHRDLICQRVAINRRVHPFA
ncbi:hypothetical protein ExPUPEC79_04104 [Escherichia coli]|nr:hypothetical protein ExPUPEC79_04104 [Escherichia coli]